jgi:hemerythrin-like metal-binding protein
MGGRMWFYRGWVACIKGNKMADLLGISPGTYSDLESCKKEPSAKVIMAYCKQPRMDIHWLLTGEWKTEAGKEIYRRSIGSHDYEMEEEVEEIEVLVLMKEHMVGDKQIDNGRKYLISLMNTIQAAVDSEFNADVGLNHVAELYTYAKEYFKIEEAIQKNIKFEGRTAHKKLHKEFIDELDGTYRYIESAEEGDHKELVLKTTYNSIENWLVEHIEEDLKMREYFE